MCKKTWWWILDKIQKASFFDAKVDLRDFWGPEMVREVWTRVRWCFLKCLRINKFGFRVGFDRLLPKFENFHEFLSIFIDFWCFWSFLKSGFWTCEICVGQYAYLNNIKSDKILINFKKSEIFKNLKNHKILT